MVRAPRRTIPSSAFTRGKLVTTGLSVAAGYALFRLIFSTRGRRITDLIQATTPDLRTVFVMFILGLGVFFGFAIL